LQTTGNDDQTVETTTTPEPSPEKQSVPYRGIKVTRYSPEELKVLARQGWSVGFVKNSRNITRTSPADAPAPDKGDPRG